MRVRSYIRQAGELVAVDVELSLQPGLPQIHFLGLPDAALRESALRIRSAIRSQGFKLPQAQQILVHLRPAHLRKSSRGLDLAVAAALLWEMDQVPLPPLGSTPIVYGALSLSGDVEVPDDADEIALDPGALVITGAEPMELPYCSWRLADLRSLTAAPVVRAASAGSFVQRPSPPVTAFSPSVARLCEVVAAGEHSLLVAGPPGSGKTTLVDSISSWLEEPIDPTAARRSAKLNGGHVWRPVVKPHHSITPLAMIGGGGHLWPGEIARAHGGVLIMDELLEFHAEIQESLREPIETGEITIARAGRHRTFPARFLMLATTNLCECGKYVPGARRDCKCRCSRAQRRRSMARLTGPFADRFQILAYSDGWRDDKGGAVAAREVGERVDGAIRFRRFMRGQIEPNALADAAAIEATLSSFQRAMLQDSSAWGASHRRHDACLRLARTFADLRQSPMISRDDLDQAVRLGQTGHRLLEDWRE